MIALIEGIPSPFPDSPFYDFRSLKTIDEFRKLTENADVIVAVDKEDAGCQTVYGAAVIDAIVQEVIAPQRLSIVVFAVEFSEATNEVELICALTEAVKGFHEWP